MADIKVYIYRKQQHEKRKKNKNKTKKEGKKDKVLNRTQTRHLRLDATTPYHYTTEAGYVTLGKSL